MRQFQNDLMGKLESLQEENPKAYWNLLEQLKNGNKNSFQSDPNIDVDDWYKYFEDLNKSNDKNNDKYI